MSLDIEFTRQGFEKDVDISHAETWRIQDECLLIFSLPGKALRTNVDIARLAKI